MNNDKSKELNKENEKMDITFEKKYREGTMKSKGMPLTNKQTTELFKSLYEAYQETVLTPGWQDRIRENKVQMEKYFRAIKFFNKIADEWGGSVETSDDDDFDVLSGGIDARYDFSFDGLMPDEILEFSEIVSYCSGFGIYPFRDHGKDGVIISCTIPDIYVIDDDE